MASFFYEGTNNALNWSILVGLCPDDQIYTCYVTYDDPLKCDTYHRFAKICDADQAQALLEHPEQISISTFTDPFGYDSFVITANGHSNAYFLDDGSRALSSGLSPAKLRI